LLRLKREKVVSSSQWQKQAATEQKQTRGETSHRSGETPWFINEIWTRKKEFIEGLGLSPIGFLPLGKYKNTPKIGWECPERFNETKGKQAMGKSSPERGGQKTKLLGKRGNPHGRANAN